MNNDSGLPLVSVITPTYNRPDYLKQAIASAVNQTYKNIEIIVSDNCSTKNTQEIVESFQDSRIRFWRQPTNVGMFANQMHAFKMAQGKYVASLHDDDMWKEDFLEKLVPPLEENPDTILAFCDQYIVDGQGKINHTGTEENTRGFKRDTLHKGSHKPFYEMAIVHKSVPIAAGSIIRNELIDWDSIPAEVGGMWDLYLSYLCCRTGRAAYYSPERLTQYRAHEQTDTMQSGNRQDPQAKIRKAKAEIFCYEQLMNDEMLQKYRPYLKEKWLKAQTSLAISLLLAQEAAKARPLLWHVFKEQKFNIRNIAALTLSFTPRIVANQVLGLAKK